MSTKTTYQVDPAMVPQRTLYTGAKMPAVGLGTFGSDRFTAKEIAGAVEGAIEVGYRHIDCAAVYANEKEIGESFAKVFANKVVTRDELWVTSKVWNDQHAPEKVIASCERSLKELQLDYLDLFLIHWPFRNFHAPGCDGDARNPESRPYNHDQYMETWNAVEQLVERGLVRHIGTSSMTLPKMRLLLRDCSIRPAANEMELHPHFQQAKLFNFMKGERIEPIGFCPIGSPTRPDRDKTEQDTVDIEDPVIVEIAKKYNVHPAVICVKWAVQRGQTPIPFSIHRNEYLGNLMASVVDQLTTEEMMAIAKIDKKCRLIKGQVFLWDGAEGWEDLWDEDGVIPNNYVG